MTRRRRRRRRRASSRFPFEGEGRRRGEDAVAPRDARLRCGSGEEGETTPERRRGWGTRVGGSSSRRPKKNRLLYMGSLFRRFQKPFFMDLASRGARFQSADFPSPKSRTASALRSTGVLQSRTPYNLRSIAPRRQKKAQVPVASKRERFDRAHTSPHAAASTWKRAPHALHHPHLSHARITAHERAPSETHERRRYARSAARSLLRVTPNQVVECQDERPRHRELVRRARHEEEEEEQGACRSRI
jgi:hypothetical protein